MIEQELLNKIQQRTQTVLNYSADQEALGLKIHKDAIVIDSCGNWPKPPTQKQKDQTKYINELVLGGDFNLNDLMDGLFSEKSSVLDCLETQPDTQAEYHQAWEKSGVNGIHCTVSELNFEETIQNSAMVQFHIDTFRDTMMKATCAEDFRKAKTEGKRAVMLGLQNANPIGGGTNLDEEKSRLELLYRFGIRTIQLTYNTQNFIGSGCMEPKDGGLSRYGGEIVGHMNKIGIMVDVSHCGEQTALDAVECSSQPVTATHTSCKSVYYHERGKSDSTLKAIADSGGHIGIYAEPYFLGGKGTIKEFLDHIDYLVDLVGINHVGIGSDVGYYNSGFAQFPEAVIEKMMSTLGRDFWYRSGRGWWLGWDLSDPTRTIDSQPGMVYNEREAGSLAWINWPYYTVGLVTRGYSESEIRKIIGENYLRYIQKVIGK